MTDKDANLPNKKIWSDADIEEFEKVCRPVVEFLQKYHCTPHHRVIIDWSSAVLIQDLKGIPFKFRIENWR